MAQYTNPKKKKNNDIAPIRSDVGLFQRADNWNDVDNFWEGVGAFGETALASTADLGVNVVKGAGRLVEGVTDLFGHGIAGLADLLGFDEWSDEFRGYVNDSWVDNLASPADEFLDEYSIFGQTGDAIGEGIGQVASLIVTGGALGAAGLSTAGISAATTSLMGASSMGSGMSEAYNAGANDKQAFFYGIMKGAIDAGSELIFGGLGKTVNALGISRGLSSLDDIVAKKLSSGISNQFFKNVVQWGVKSTAEGLEEVLAGIGTIAAKKLTYMSDEELGKLIKDENLFQQFIVGAVSAGVTQSGLIPGMKKGSLADTTKKGQDFVSGLTASEQKVADNLFEKAVKQKEADGKKLSGFEKNKIFDGIVKQMESGDIDVETIEDILKEDVYKDNKAKLNEEDALFKEYEELGKKKSNGATLAEETRYKELHDKTKELTFRKDLDSRMSEEVYNRVKDSRLASSYADAARRGDAFQADINEYDEAERATIQSAIDAGFLNNTNKTRRFVNWIAKIAAKTGIKVDFTTNEKLKQSGFAIDGKTINGYKTKDGIGINMQSKKVLETVVGHEITHVLEGTELYNEMQKILYDYADSKGELSTRRKAIENLYKGMKADIDSELTAELVGDYLFADQEFINRLANDNRNLFQKMWDEVKYMWSQAHPSSPEAQKLEKLKRVFEKAYEESDKKRIINKLTGEEIDQNTYKVLERLNKGERVSAEEIANLKEVKEGKLKLDKMITEFLSKHPEFAGIEFKDVGTYLLEDAERIRLREEIISKRLTEGSFSHLDKNGKEVYNGVVRKDKRIDIVIGLPASGKSSSIVNPLSQFYNSVVIDSDIIKAMLPEFDGGWGASLVHEESSMLNTSLLNESLKLGNNIVLPVVGAKVRSVEKYIELAKERGYDVNVHLNELSNAKATGRMLLRYFNTGRFINPTYTAGYGDKPTEVYEQIKQRGDIDGYSRWSNDVAKDKRPNLTEISENNRLYGQYSATWRASRGADAGRNDSSGKSGEAASAKPQYSISESPDQDAERGYARTDDFRRLQAESQAMSDEDVQLYHSGDKQIDDGIRERFSRGVKQIFLDSRDNGISNAEGILKLSAKNNNFNVYEGVNPAVFHDVFEMARKHLKYGELVDLHEVETTNDHGVGYKYCYNYLSDDGLSGFSITPDGDLISVFNASGKSGFLRAISSIVSSKAKTLDCYASPNQNLKDIYSAIFGFKTASIMDYNMEYDHDNIAANHNKPQVAFMVNTESDVEVKHFTEDQYDEAVAYRDSFVDNDTQFSISEDTETTPRDVYFSRIDEVYDKLKGKAAGKSHSVDGYNFFLQKNDFDESAYISITTPDGEKLRHIVDGGNQWKNARLWLEAAKMVSNHENPNVATATTQEEAGEYSEIEGKREETKKTFKEKVGDAKTLGRKAVGYLVDKYQPIENLALKTGNRELDAKANTMRTSERAAQHFIGNGADGVRAINDLRQEVEASGLENEFEEYMYDLLTTDRMSLEERAKPIIKKLGDKFKNMKLYQIKALAKKEITQKTTETSAQYIRDAREYLRAISARNKPVRGDFYTSDIARAHATELEQKYPQFKQWAEDVYANTNFMLNKLVADGELSQEAADRFRELYPHYVPIRRVNKEGKAIDVPLYSNRTGVDAPIKGATGGDGTIGYLFETLAMRAEQTFLAGAKNRFGIELKNTLKAKTTDADVDVEDIFEEVDTHEDRLKAGEDGQAPTFTVFENGKRVTFEIPEDIYDALKPTPEALKGTIPVLSAITKWQRNVLTEYNPAFMLRNFFKDSQDAFINSQHAKETFLNYPEAFSQLYAYAKGTGGDTNWVQEYLANGGENLTYFDGKEKLFDSKNTKNPWSKEDTATWKKVVGFVPAKISEASNFIERVPRLAEYIASRKAGASIDVAMLDAARVTTNFAAGGDVTKYANRNGATFLNASVQGAAQAVRNIREAKAQGLKGMLKLGAKVAIAGIPYLIANALLWGDDDEYEELSDYIKENYYIVAKYGDGQFVRIPKGRMAAVIQSAFQQMSNLVTGNDEVDFERFGELLVENIAPNNPAENNIFAPIMNVAENKTWYGDDLVPQRLQDLPAGEQSDETTDAISKWLGETINVSPYKLNYLLDQYSGVFGDVLLPYATPQAEGGNSSILGGAIAPLADQFTTDSTMKNQNVSDFYDTLDDLTASAKSKHATDGDVLRYKYMNAVNSDISALYKQKREVQNSSLSNSVKYERVREVQRQIDELAKQALAAYNGISVRGNTATVGGYQFKKNKKGEWEKVRESSSSSNWSNDLFDWMSGFSNNFDIPDFNLD